MTIGAAQQFFLGASKATGGGGAGYQIERSLRFNSSDSAYLSRTPAVAGSRTTWTWAGWVKRSVLDSDVRLFEAGTSSTDVTWFGFVGANSFRFEDYSSGSYKIQLGSSALYRDVSAWYHLVVAVDTTQATSTDRVKLYVNGTQIVNFSLSTYPSPSFDTRANNTVLHTTGGSAVIGGSAYFNGYLANVQLIDGQQLTPSSFTEVSATTGQLIPKAYTGSFGTNGFKLTFSDNSNNTATTLGKDTSGNGNNFTPNNFVAGGTDYAATGSDSNSKIAAGTYQNFWTGNLSSSITISQGGYVVMTNTTLPSATSTIGFYTQNGASTATLRINGTSVFTATSSTLQWYDFSYSGAINKVEIGYLGGSGSSNSFYAFRVDGTTIVGVRGSDIDSLVDTPTSYGTDTGAGGEVRGNYATLNPLDVSSLTTSDGNLRLVASAAGYVRGTMNLAGKTYWEVTITTAGLGGIIGIMQPNGAFPYTNSNGYHSGGTQYVNGSSVGSWGASWTTNDVIGIAIDADAGTITAYKNGASQGSKSISSTSTWMPWIHSYDGTNYVNFGQRPFAYTAPTGFKALCDTNLPAPVVAKPSTVFDVITYTGTGSSLTLPNGSSTPTSISFTPDFAWLKGRSGATDHALYDAVRGVQKDLVSNSTSAETTETTGLTAFGTNTFTVGSLAKLNTSSSTYVAWAWNAGGSTVSNTQGSITSQVRANVSAGFSVVTWTSPSSGDYTIGHGLGVAPSLVITKSRSASGDQWYTFHRSVCTSTSNYLKLSSTDGLSTYAGAWGATLPTSTVVGLNAGGGFIPSSATAVAYCFAPVSGYTSAGSYTGNGSADGPFVYTSMRPRWILLKRTDSTGNWTILDTARAGYNVDNNPLFPNLGDVEGTADLADILSNGFKLRSTDASVNASGGTYIYYAISETAFQYSRAR